MPPRLQPHLAYLAQPVATASIPTFLVPFLHQQSRNASILASLSDIPAAYNKKIRRGRGPSSGKGKTSGRGHKGQKQHGKVPHQFQGGQTPDEVVRGKEGFKNLFALEMSPINLDRIQDWINQGRIDPSKPITLRELAATRAVHGIKDGIKLLARGATALTAPINIVVSRASQSAIAAVEALGGTVTTRYYTKYAIHRIRQRKTDPYVSLKWDQDAIGKSALAVGMGSDPKERVKGMGFQYRLPDPTSRKDLEYYRDPKNRGYLSHMVKEGESPSLYFKPPQPAHEIQAKKGQKKKDPEKQAATENRLW